MTANVQSCGTSCVCQRSSAWAWACARPAFASWAMSSDWQVTPDWWCSSCPVSCQRSVRLVCCALFRSSERSRLLAHVGCRLLLSFLWRLGRPVWSKPGMSIAWSDTLWRGSHTLRGHIRAPSCSCCGVSCHSSSGCHHWSCGLWSHQRPVCRLLKGLSNGW